MRGELLELAARVCREALDPERERAGDLGGRLDRVAVEHVASIDAERGEQPQLGQRRDLEAGAERVQPREQRGLGVALDGVVQADPGQRPAHPRVGALDRVEIEREERRWQAQGVERSRVEPVVHGQERAHVRPRSRSSKAGMASA